jgi:hypothetical protein
MLIALFRNERLDQLHALCICNIVDTSDRKKEGLIETAISCVPISSSSNSNYIPATCMLTLWEKLLQNDAIRTSISETNEVVICADPSLLFNNVFEQQFPQGSVIVRDFGSMDLCRSYFCSA